MTDADRAHWKHETEVEFRGQKRTVFFDYEGDHVIIWCFEGENVCLGEDTTDAEKAMIYQHLWAWLEDWWATAPDDDQC